MNIVIVQGRLRTAPTPVGSDPERWSFDVITGTGADACTVPVSWVGRAPSASLTPGAPVTVAGRASRRFFRSGGVTHSRTEVIATLVTRGRGSSTSDGELARALRSIDAEHLSRLRSALPLERPLEARARRPAS